MPDTPTPGQIAYEAYQMAYDCFIWTLPWAQLQPHFRQVWEAAAQAVAARAITDLLEVQRILTKGQDMPRFQFALGQHVRRTSDPTQRWEIWWRSYQEEVGRMAIDYGLRLVDPETDYHPCRMSDESDLSPFV